VAIRGDAPGNIGIFLDGAERRAFVQDNLHTYWRGVGERLAAGLEASTEEHYGSEVLEWVALGVARMLYTWETGDVASKSGAGTWAARRFAEFAPMLDAAVSLRATPGTSTRAQLLDAAALVEFAVESTR
jgi:hypothetical protein